jgi:uncharacterized protein (TIGR02246 family)
MQTKPATDEQADERAIRQLVDKWLAASEKGDLATVLALMADDVIFMVPGKEPFGKEVFTQNFREMKDTSMKTRSDIQEIKVVDDWAWMRNFLRIEFTPPNGKASTHSGYVLTVLLKSSDGNWVIARDANLLVPERPEEK